MNRQRTLWIFLSTLSWLASFSAGVRAQDSQAVELTVRLRAGDGTAVIGEAIVLQRLPDEEEISPACRTDAGGACRWPVPPGLYQLLFDRPPDELSALALAEGGLRGLGITVGAAPITYHVALHSDGRVYFDGAPEAAVPMPIIPEWTDLGEERPVTREPAAVALLPIQPSATPEANIPAGGNSALPTRRLLFFLILGLAAGGGLHLYSRRRRASLSRRARSAGKKPPARPQRVIDQEPPDA
jgi:hypothetical protein